MAGDVLVSHTAAPELVELLDRVGAVVTDVGGLLCHLVLVAREMGVVSVVGTQFASRELLSGERIIVDGERGLVLRGSEAELDLQSAPVTKFSSSCNVGRDGPTSGGDTPLTQPTYGA
jgi:pyruvate,water dikinase